ncbi:ribose-5-phosphate isomerase RpiA [Foetidibacter luteolus]|uniref:ribose-5-phosphate isomerase RpiA n=1 Tax=Foetidibacter luteolus TaxID=2608880 RepID=UPI00129A84BD|nr:ribose-5-phosphate isomerase RpiA [Foetidibacter luteolus]
MLTQQQVKQKAAEYAARYVQPGMTIGLGTGSTVFFLIHKLAELAKSGLNFRAVPTSNQTKKMAEELGIPLTTLDDVDVLDLTIDGADEVDPDMQLIKGGGAALLQEKIVAAAGSQLIIIADETKMVTQLGAFPLPVEVITFGWKQVQRKVLQAGCKEVNLRVKDGQPLVTDHQHYILDCHYGVIENPAALNTGLHAIPGVVETGLFINMATKIITANTDGTIKER